MEIETVTFRTMEPIYSKEKSGVKPNTTRDVDFKDPRFRALARMVLGYQPIGYIKIEHSKDRHLNFTRKIKDITFFKDQVIISWEVFKVFEL